MSEKIHKIIRKLKFRINYIRSNFKLEKSKKSIKFLIPQKYQENIKYLKYFLSLAGLFSSLLIFNSAWISFLIAVLFYIISLFLEKTAFIHLYAFIHPMPEFEINPDKWVGVGFGYKQTLDKEIDIPLVSMVVTDLEYARKLENLFLKWTNENRIDEEKNVQISVTVTDEDEYIFLFYPSPKRQVARKFFQSARDKLKNQSLNDEVGELHATFIFGKRCKIGKSSYFPQFRKRYREGVPVMFDFIISLNGNSRVVSEIPSFIFFDFSIKDKSELTRKDLAYDAIDIFKHGGKWQGPTEENNCIDSR